MTEENKHPKVDPDTNAGLIIEKKELLTKLAVYSQWSYNALAWVVWFLLLRPLIIVALWYLGLKMTYFQMIELEGIKNPEFFRWLTVVLCCIFLVMLFWNRYNAYRFRGKDRRQSRGDCDSADMAEYYQILPEQIDAMKKAGNIDFYFPEPETVAIDCGDGKTINALYAPQNLGRHFPRQVHARTPQNQPPKSPGSPEIN